MTARPSLFSFIISGKKLIILTVHLTSAFSHLTSKDSKVIQRSFVGRRKVVGRSKKGAFTCQLTPINCQLCTIGVV